MVEMLKYDPSERITAPMASRHSFFRGAKQAVEVPAKKLLIHGSAMSATNVHNSSNVIE